MQQPLRAIRSAALALIAAVLAAAPAISAPPLVTPASVLAAAPAADWAKVDPHDLLAVDLAGGGGW